MSRYKSQPARGGTPRAGAPAEANAEEARSDESRGARELRGGDGRARAPADPGEGVGVGRSEPPWLAPDVPARVPPSEAPPIEFVRHEIPEGASLDRRLVLLREPDSPQAASFRVLRHHLADVGSPQMIAVTSAHAGERKTTCAINLAAALAEAGQARVAVVDAHRRRPEVARALGFAPPQCFWSQLEASGGAPLGTIKVVDVEALDLHVLGAEVSQSVLRHGPSVVAGFEALRLCGYDHIVVDAPPVLGSADVNVLQDGVDAVLVTALRKRTTARDLRGTEEQLGAAKIVGTALFED